MNNGELLEEIKVSYNKLLIIDSIVNLEMACRDIFDNFSAVFGNEELLEFINQVKIAVQLSGTDIANTYDDQNVIIKILQAQVGFFLSFYSFLVSTMSFEIDDNAKDEISSWFVDILSNLRLCMDLEKFMDNFVISFHPHLAAILFDIYESMGMDIPSTIKPDGYKTDDDIMYNIPIPIVKKVRKSAKKISLEESYADLTKTERNCNRTVIGSDTCKKVKEQVPAIITTKPLSRAKSSASRLETKTQKNSDKKKTEKEGSSKKLKKRKSLAPETPNCKIDCVTRPHRVAAAAAKKLNGKLCIPTESPVISRTNVLTPITQRRLRRVESINMKRQGDLRCPKPEVDLWVKRQRDEERSLTNFSQDSMDRSVSSFDFNKRTTRFRSRLFDSFMSPNKDKIPNPVLADTILSARIAKVMSPSQLNVIQSSSLFSPRKTTTKSLLSPKKFARKLSPTRATIMSPMKTKATSPAVNVLTTPVNLKSCIRSPIKRQSTVLAITKKINSTKRRKTIDAKEFPCSVLLSPKIKQRTFLSNKPPQDFCEDTMYMDTNEFIRSSGRATLKQDYNLKNYSSPGPGFCADSSQSSFDSVPIDRLKAVPNRRLSIQRKLFDGSPSNIRRENILTSSRRSAIIAPNFFSADPETDESNGFKL